MCLITDQKKPKIAEEDMTVYKILIENKGIYSAMFQDFEYDLNVLYKTIIKRSSDMSGMDDIDEDALTGTFGNWKKSRKLVAYGQGYHSAYKEERLENLARDFGGVIMECTIPKGSKYYDNISGLVVSNQLIIIKQVN